MKVTELAKILANRVNQENYILSLMRKLADAIRKDEQSRQTDRIKELEEALATTMQKHENDNWRDSKRIKELEEAIINIRRMAMGTSRRSYKDIINCTNEALKKVTP